MHLVPQNSRRKALNDHIDDALLGGGMILVLKCKDGKLHLFRHTEVFPKAEIETALQLLTEDLSKVNIAPPVVP